MTGSVAVVGSDIFKDKGTVSNPLQAMQGQVPGFVSRVLLQLQVKKDGEFLSEGLFLRIPLTRY